MNEAQVRHDLIDPPPVDDEGVVATHGGYRLFCENAVEKMKRAERGCGILTVSLEANEE